MAPWSLWGSFWWGVCDNRITLIINQHAQSYITGSLVFTTRSDTLLLLNEEYQSDNLCVRDKATVGFYYWKHGSDFVKYAEMMIEKGFAKSYDGGTKDQFTTEDAQAKGF